MRYHYSRCGCWRSSNENRITCSSLLLWKILLLCDGGTQDEVIALCQDDSFLTTLALVPTTYILSVVCLFWNHDTYN